MHLAIYHYGAFGGEVPATLILGAYGENAGSKLVKANELGTKILTEGELFDMLK